MARYLKTTASNPGAFSVRVEANPLVEGSEAYYVNLSTEPTEIVDDQTADHILNTNHGKVEDAPVLVAVDDPTDDVVVATVKRVKAKLFDRS